MPRRRRKRLAVPSKGRPDSRQAPRTKPILKMAKCTSVMTYPETFPEFSPTLPISRPRGAKIFEDVIKLSKINFGWNLDEPGKCNKTVVGFILTQECGFQRGSQVTLNPKYHVLDPRNVKARLDNNNKMQTDVLIDIFFYATCVSNAGTTTHTHGRKIDAYLWKIRCCGREGAYEPRVRGRGGGWGWRVG